MLFFIHHGTRGVFVAGMTTNPTRDWVTQCARNVSEDLGDAAVTVRYLLRDRDGRFGPGFDAVWQGEGASILPSPVRAPDANAVAERWVRTARSECADGLLILNDGHLRRVLDRYVRHYNEHRPHRGLALRPPMPVALMPPKPATIASIRRQEILGGLTNEYHPA